MRMGGMHACMHASTLPCTIYSNRHSAFVIYIYCVLLHSLYNQYSFTVVVRAVPLQRMHLVAAIAKLSCPRYANACKGCIAWNYMYSNRHSASVAVLSCHVHANIFYCDNLFITLCACPCYITNIHLLMWWRRCTARPQRTCKLSRG